MTNTEQVKNITRILMHQNSDLVRIGRLIYVLPIRHFIRYISLDRTSDKSEIRPVWSVKSLCAPTEQLGYFNIHRIYPDIIGNWDINTPNIEKILPEKIERSVLSYLRKIDNFKEFNRFANMKCFTFGEYRNHYIYKIYNDIAEGSFSDAEEICQILKEPISEWQLPPELQRKYDIVTQVLCPLIHTRNRTALAAVLHESEAYSVRQLKLEKFWQPSRFPIELEDHELKTDPVM